MSTLRNTMIGTTAAFHAPETGNGNGSLSMDDARAMVLSGDINLKAWRGGFKRLKGRDLALTDDQMLEVVCASDDDMTDEAWVNAFEAAEGDDTTEATANSISASAVLHSRKAVQSKELDTVGRSVIAAGETVKRGPLLYLDTLTKVYTAEELSEFPIVDSEKGNNPDIFYRREKNAKGGWKKVKDRAYWVFASEQPYGNDIDVTLDRISKAQSKHAERVSPWKEMGEEELEKQRKKWTARKTAFRGLVIRSFKLHQYIEAISEMSDKINLMLDRDDAGNLTEETYPITIQDKAKPAKFSTLSVSQFLTIDIAAALKNGGTYQAVVDTIGRSTSDDEQPEDEAIGTARELLTTLQHVNQFLDNEGKAAALLKLVEGKAGDENMLVVGDAITYLMTYWTEKHQKRYQRLVLARSESVEAPKAKTA